MFLILQTFYKHFFGSVKMFLRSRQAGHSNRKQRPNFVQTISVTSACEVSSRYFVVGNQIPGCRHILTGLFVALLLSNLIKDYCIPF